MEQSMKTIFLNLVTLPSPSGREQLVATYIATFLRSLGATVTIDDAGTVNDSDTGNVIATFSGNTPTYLLVAHMDTVQKSGEMVHPQFDGSMFTSDGTTILGSDDKTGVAALLAVAQTIAKRKTHPTIHLAFTTHEEAGQMGSSLLNVPSLSPDFIMNVDGSRPVGTINTRALGQIIYTITVEGKAAHAALHPEQGINAVAIAGYLVTHLPTGLLSNGSTANVGSIAGGGSTNVVPHHATIRGEARAFSPTTLEQYQQEITSLVHNTAAKYHTPITILWENVNGVPAWEGNNNKQLIEKVSQACNMLSIPFTTTDLRACSDANYLGKWGIPTINVNVGGVNPHSVTEHVALSEMERLRSLILTIIEDA